MAHPIVATFYRSTRLAQLNQARHCLRWLRLHESRGEWCDAANVRQAFLGYLAHARHFSRLQKEMNAKWEGLPLA